MSIINFSFLHGFFSKPLPFVSFSLLVILCLIGLVLVQAVSRRATLHETIRDYEQAASDLHGLISLLEKQSQEKVQQCGSPDGSAGGNVKELRQARRRLSSVEEKAKKGISFDHYLIL